MSFGACAFGGWVFLAASLVGNYRCLEKGIAVDDLNALVVTLQAEKQDLSMQLSQKKLQLEANEKLLEAHDEFTAELKKSASGQLGDNKRVLEANANYIAELKQNKCGSFLDTPKGVASLLEYGSNSYAWLFFLSICGNWILCQIVPFLWNMITGCRNGAGGNAGNEVAENEDGHFGEEAVVPVYLRPEVFIARSGVRWLIAIWALFILPPLACALAGDLAVYFTQWYQDRICQGNEAWGWACDNVFYYGITANAKLEFINRMYNFAFQGWQRVVTMSFVSTCLDQCVVVPVICLMSYPYTRRWDGGDVLLTVGQCAQLGWRLFFGGGEDNGADALEDGEDDQDKLVDQ